MLVCINFKNKHHPDTDKPSIDDGRDVLKAARDGFFEG
jgi:hypothetical protein